ncbi:MAG: hypothetical protein SNJ29_12990 [Rikenellaceae bacterium]
MTKRDVLNEMKSRRGKDTIIIFHNGAYFEIYEEDAIAVSEVLSRTTMMIDDTLTIQIPETEQETTTNRLLDAGFGICLCEMVDSSGRFVVGINEFEDE